MADLTPIGPLVSFGGVTISGLAGYASSSYPSIDKVPVEAYEQLLGSNQVVDLFNSVNAPTHQTLTCQVLIRASDGTTGAAAAWAEVVAGYRALEGLPQTGTLVVAASSGGGSVSCPARRKPIPVKLSPQNARHLVVDLTFTLLGDFA